MYQVLYVNWSALVKGILPTLQSHGWTMVPMGVAIRQWGPGFASTDCGAHYCIIGHCVGVMATHGVSQTVVFATSHPSSSHPTRPAAHPTHPLYYQY